MPHKIKPQKYVCEVCEKDFKGPGKGYLCSAGANEGDKHVVAAKKYYSGSGGLLLQWKTDQTFPNPNGGAAIFVPGKSAQFIQGTFTSTDPEEQDYLNEYPGCISYEQWFELFVPEKMRNEQRAREAAHNKVVIANQNTELEALRKKLGLDPKTGLDPNAKPEEVEEDGD